MTSTLQNPLLCRGASFDPEILNRLEGLNEHYRALGERVKELEGRIGESATYDLPPDTEQLGALVDAQRRIKVTKFSEGKEVAALFKEALARIEA